MESSGQDVAVCSSDTENGKHSVTLMGTWLPGLSNLGRTETPSHSIQPTLKKHSSHLHFPTTASFLHPIRPFLDNRGGKPSEVQIWTNLFS